MENLCFLCLAHHTAIHKRGFRVGTRTGSAAQVHRDPTESWSPLDLASVPSCGAERRPAHRVRGHTDTSSFRVSSVSRCSQRPTPRSTRSSRRAAASRHRRQALLVLAAIAAAVPRTPRFATPARSRSPKSSSPPTRSRSSSTTSRSRSNIPPYDHRPGGPHIDGHVRQQPDQVKPHSFTLLAGIFLSDETEIDQGSVWVWPGSHLVHQQLFRDRGTDVLMQNGGHITMLRDPPPLGAPVPVLGRRGDLLAGALPSRPQHGWQPQPHHTADAVLPARLPRPRRAVGTPRSSTPSRSTPLFDRALVRGITTAWTGA